MTQDKFNYFIDVVIPEQLEMAQDNQKELIKILHKNPGLLEYKSLSWYARYFLDVEIEHVKQTRQHNHKVSRFEDLMLSTNDIVAEY